MCKATAQTLCSSTDYVPLLSISRPEPNRQRSGPKLDLKCHCFSALTNTYFHKNGSFLYPTVAETVTYYYLEVRFKLLLLTPPRQPSPRHPLLKFAQDDEGNACLRWQSGIKQILWDLWGLCSEYKKVRRAKWVMKWPWQVGLRRIKRGSQARNRSLQGSEG